MTTTAKAPRKTLTRPKIAATGNGGAEAPAPKAIRPGPVDVLVIGGEPRVSLLPPQVIARKKVRLLRRRLALALVALVVIVAVGVALATLSMVAANSTLAAAQSETSNLLQQQTQYGRVLKVKADVSAVQAAQKLATGQEIAWQPFIMDVQNTLPAGATITSLAASIDAPFQAEVPTTVPLQGPRIATVNVTLSMPQASISGWLDTLPQLKGYVDATPNSITAGTPGANYTVAVTIHLNKAALENRFTKAGAKK